MMKMYSWLGGGVMTEGGASGGYVVGVLGPVDGLPG